MEHFLKSEDTNVTIEYGALLALLALLGSYLLA